jgi:hypothetical protein
MHITGFGIHIPPISRYGQIFLCSHPTCTIFTTQLIATTFSASFEQARTKRLTINQPLSTAKKQPNRSTDIPSSTRDHNHNAVQSWQERDTDNFCLYAPRRLPSLSTCTLFLCGRASSSIPCYTLLEISQFTSMTTFVPLYD